MHHGFERSRLLIGVARKLPWRQPTYLRCLRVVWG
jgi:hypothetical protein